MRKSIKIFIAMFTLIIGIIQTPVIVLATNSIPNATSDFYVNDFAQVFSSNEKSRLMDNAVELSKQQDGIQVVVTTIKSLNGDSIENYALEMYNQYGIGKNDMGILILLATEDRQIRVEVGRAMESYINDSKAGRFIDKYAISYLKDNKFNEGLITLQEAFISEINTCIEKENSQVAENSIVSNSEIKNVISKQTVYSFFAFTAFILLFVLVIYFIYMLIKKSNDTKKRINDLTVELEKQKTKSTQQKERFNSEIASIKETHKKETDAIIQKNIRENMDLSSEHNRKVNSLKEEIHNLTMEKNKINSDYQSLKNDYSTLQDRYRRVNLLFPNADSEVTAMIEEEIRQYDIEKAAEVDQLISEVINLEADKDLVSKLSNVLSSYNSLEEKQKSYVKSDIDKLTRIYQNSISLKEEYEKEIERQRILKQIEEYKNSANNAMKSITSIISCISVGKSKDLSPLKKAKSIYESLPNGALEYFDNSIINKVNKLLTEAQEDYDREEKISNNKKLAAAAIASIVGIIGYISYGKARDLRKLQDAKNIYDRLDPEVRKYADTSVIEKLERLIREAKRDKEEEEEEERRRKRREEEERRRRMHSSSSSSYRSSSFHSGFGGRSGGGGASRGF